MPVARADVRDDGVEEVGRVDYGEPLHLDGDDVEEQHPCLREERREGEEHAQVDVGRAHEIAAAVDEIGDEAVDYREQHAHRVVDGEAPRPPLALERGADEIVEVQEQQQRYDAVRLRHEDEGDYPPHLPAQHGGRVEGEEAREGARAVHGPEQPDGRRAHDYGEHQVVYAEARVLIAEQVDPLHETSHYKSSRSDNEAFNILPQERGKFQKYL